MITAPAGFFNVRGLVKGLLVSCFVLYGILNRRRRIRRGWAHTTSSVSEVDDRCFVAVVTYDTLCLATQFEYFDKLSTGLPKRLDKGRIPRKADSRPVSITLDKGVGQMDTPEGNDQMVVDQRCPDSPEPADQGVQLPQPRGSRRLLYTSDPSNLAFYQAGRTIAHKPGAAGARSDPARPEDLTGWVDELAEYGIDSYAQVVFSQGWTVLFRSERFEYDARPQHQRFVEMLESGPSPLEVLIDRTHQRGMEFFAKFRMNDRHGAGGQGARFILENRQWGLQEFPGGLDYSFGPVRDFMLAAADEVVERFDVDGLLFNYIRHMHCFPTDAAADRHPLMTDFLRRVRHMLDRRSGEKKKRLTLGVMVPQTLDECHALGYDVPTWIREGLIDYVCPCDFGYADFNAPYEEFSALTHSSGCYLYPTLSPLLCRGDDATLLRPESYRALAQAFYAAGADGVSVFNYQYHWARLGGTAEYPGSAEGYPLTLSYLQGLEDPQEVAHHMRHYRYHPLWGGPCATGATKNDRLVLTRRDDACGAYTFRLRERLADVGRATLYFTAQGLLPEDEISVNVNGVDVADFRRSFHPDGRLERYGRPLTAFSTVFFDLGSCPPAWCENSLGVTLLKSAQGARGEIVIDELEVIVRPLK